MSCPKCESGQKHRRWWPWISIVLLAVVLLALVAYST
jgi:hypothetical protein